MPIVEPQVKRTIAFFDGQNLFHAAKEAFGYPYPNYDPHSLANAVCRQKGWALSGIRFYTGLIWKAHGDHSHLLRHTQVLLPSHDPSNTETLFLIDGQKDTSSESIASVISRLDRAEFDDGEASRQFVRKWKQISDCVELAVDHLYKLEVTNFSFLPSDPMIAVLAFFFHANNRAQPNSRQHREIRKWFWATGAARRYVGRGYYNNIRHDLEFFKRLGRRRKGRFEFKDLMPLSELRRTDYTSGGSLTIAFFLMLAQRKPCYLETGAPMPLEKTASVANRKDKHHIFPKSLLRRNAFSVRKANSLSNICYLVAEENQSFGSNKSVKYLEDYKRLKHFARVMKSHLIPYRSDSALWKRNVRSAYRQFSAQRIDLIRRAFEKEAGMRLFRKE